MNAKFNISDVNIHEQEKSTGPCDFFSYYRMLRPENFSDTVVTYGVPLTRELFQYQLESLSTNKKQNEFEQFVLRCAQRRITPNIKPQSGPDGGGDGKVDGETFIVSSDIADKWYVADGGCVDNETWAIAISCKKQWKPKVEKDVESIVSTGRGYNRILFFSNQKIKSSELHKVEDSLKEKYSILVSIFDGAWCESSVFDGGCMQIALDTLNFSEEYRKKTVTVGPNDSARKKRLQELEESIVTCHIEGLDTDYIEVLLETCILSRGLERPRSETEGRFNRCLRECEKHGTTQQKFNVIYSHGWTSFYWFEDVEATCRDYLTLKEFTYKEPSVYRIEKLTNLLTNLSNASNAGMFESDKVGKEFSDLSELLDKLTELNPNSSVALFLRIFFYNHKLITAILNKEDIDEILLEIEPLILESANHVDISFDMQCTIMSNMGKVIKDNARFESLLDKLADVLSVRDSEVAGARVRYSRAQQHLENKNFKAAVRQFGFCVAAFEKEGCETEFVQTSGLMAEALYNLGLPYSAKAYFVRSVAYLIKQFYAEGNIPHILISALLRLCEIELMAGNLVMFLNWRELLYVVANNGQTYQEKDFIERNALFDCSWACRLADASMNNPVLSILPDILERADMPISSNVLKKGLGYNDKIDTQMIDILQEDWRKKLLNQPVFQQFLSGLNISSGENAKLSTKVNGCIFEVTYKNECDDQIVAEIFLAAIESLLATFDWYDVVIMTKKISLLIVHTSDENRFDDAIDGYDYALRINPTTFNDEIYWKMFSMFMAYFFTKKSMTKADVTQMIEEKHRDEKLMDRLTVLMCTKLYYTNVLGMKFKNCIEDWHKESDTLYEYKGEVDTHESIGYTSRMQVSNSVYMVSSDVSLWDNAGWKGCAYLTDMYMQKPTIFGLAFNNIENGRKILSEWKEQLGKGMPSVKVYLIAGINRNNPNHYRVCLAPDMSSVVPQKENERYCATVSRKHTMTPNDNVNYERFKCSYKRFGCCWMMPFEITTDMKLVEPKEYKEAFKFTNVIFKNAWEIGTTDEAIIALEPTDDPFIPPAHISDAPVLEVMDMLHKISRQK